MLRLKFSVFYCFVSILEEEEEGEKENTSRNMIQDLIKTPILEESSESDEDIFATPPTTNKAKKSLKVDMGELEHEITKIEESPMSSTLGK